MLPELLKSKFLEYGFTIFSLLKPIENKVKEKFLLRNKDIFIKHKIFVPIEKITTEQLSQIMYDEIESRGAGLIEWLFSLWLGKQKELSGFFLGLFAEKDEGIFKKNLEIACERFGVYNVLLYSIYMGFKSYWLGFIASRMDGGEF